MRKGIALMVVVCAAVAQDAGVVEGHVRDADGAPVAGRIVTAVLLTGRDPLMRAAETDAEGRYAISGLPPGDYVLMLSEKPPERRAPNGGVLEELLIQASIKALEKPLLDMLRKGIPADHPDRVTVGAKQTARHDFRLPRSADVALVVSQSGRPLAGVEVRMRGRDTGWRMQGDVPRTDAKGRVLFESVPEGSYAVLLETKEWTVACGTIRVEGKEPLEMPVAVGPYSVRIRLYDARGEPVTQAEPGISLLGDGWHYVHPPFLTEDPRADDGLFVVPYAREGTYRAYVNTHGTQVKATGIAVGPENPSPEVVLRLPPTGTLVVRMVDAQGRPVPGAHVRIEHSSGIPGFGYDSDENGIYRMGLTAEVWRVGHDQNLRDVQVKPFEETVVTVRVAAED